MSKIRVTENELKQIIRESVENVISMNEEWQPWGPAPKDPSTEPINPEGPGASITKGQADERNANATNALAAWKKLGTIGQIKTIQRLAGIPAAQCDGKIGPQTLAKVYIALSKGRGEAINPEDLSQSSFRPGKVGTYTPITY